MAKSKDMHQIRASLPALPCACSTLRRAARAVTQLYDRELRPSGLRVTQFALLMALEQADGMTQGALGKLLALDSTSLTRMLGLVEERGWIRSSTGDDQRKRHLHLTAAGRRKLAEARAGWERAQQRLLAVLGEDNWNRLNSALDRTTRSARSI
jgi:DNA-binding MarR family transcriptional regulator